MKKTNRLMAVLALATVAGLALAGCSSGSRVADEGGTDAGGLTTLKVATTPNISLGAVYMGEEEGFFKDEGLKLELIPVANPPASLAAVQSGQVDVGYTPSIPLLNALSQSVPVKVIAAADGFAEGTLSGDPEEVDDTGLYASPSSGITSIKDLSGKTIAVPARKAQLEVTIAAALEEAGVDPNSVEWIALDFTSAVSALEAGTVDAAGLVSPFNRQAADAGAPLLASPAVSFFEEGAVGVWIAGDKTVDSKADAIAAFQRAIIRTNEFANENPEPAIKAGLKNSKSSLSVDQVKVPYWPTTVTTDDIKRVDEKMVRLGYLSKPVDHDNLIVSQ